MRNFAHLPRTPAKMLPIDALRLSPAGNVAEGSWSCGNAWPTGILGGALVRCWLWPDRGHKRPDADDVHDAGEIVGEYV
jgi:hypothetical protein